MVKKLWEFFHKIFQSTSDTNKIVYNENYDARTNTYYLTQSETDSIIHQGKLISTAVKEAISEGLLPAGVKVVEVPYWDWDEYWLHKKRLHRKKNRGQWDFYTISIQINDKTITDQIYRSGKKYHIRSITPHSHITVHYPFTIKDGFKEDDLFRVSSRILSQYNALTFSINEILWLHKHRDYPGNIIAFGIDQSGDFEKIRIDLTNELNPYVFATASFEKDPGYKPKARPHISIAYGLDYSTAERLYSELTEQQRGVNSTIFHQYPVQKISLRKQTGKHTTFFNFDFRIKDWKR